MDEAERSEGIKTAEGRMIKGVLDMEDIEVCCLNLLCECFEVSHLVVSN